MLNKIIKYSITHKLVIGLLTLALVITGIYSLKQLPVDAVPDITNNQVQVITSSPTLAAQEVERLITFPIEITMATIPQIEEIRSFSRFGLSVVTIVFEEDVDEVSMSGAAGAYLTPYAFRKKGAKADDEAYKELGYKLVKENHLSFNK